MRPSHTKLLERIKDEIEAGQFTTGGDPKQQKNILRIGKENKYFSFKFTGTRSYHRPYISY